MVPPRTLKFLAFIIIMILLLQFFSFFLNKSVTQRQTALVGPNGDEYDIWKRRSCQEVYDNFTIHASQIPSGDEVSCKRAQINPSTACHVMERMLNADDVYCSKPNNITLCEQTWDIDSNVYSFNCSFVQMNCARVYLGTIDSESGIILWERFSDRKIGKLEKRLVQISTKEDFVFVRCALTFVKFFAFKLSGYSLDVNRSAQQLFSFQKALIKNDARASKTNKLAMSKKPSINLLFIDSVSRTIMYYAWPKVISLLRRLSASKDRKVFEYKLFQSIDTGTISHMYRLFNGPNDTTKVAEDEFLQSMGKHFFRKMKESGYMTSFSRDICYADQYRSQKRYDFQRFSMLLQHKKDLELDDMGVSASICQMLESSTGRWNMLYEYEKCFNGQRITHHQLNQLHNTQKYWYSKGLKFFTMMETNMAHNDHFTHIKHLDASMAYYLHQVTSDMNDVMSIVLSDHSNKWSHYVQSQSPEGVRDKWHPFLFIVMPENPLRFFTPDELKAMEINQERLLTVTDVHYLLTKFSKQGEEEERSVRVIGNMCKGTTGYCQRLHLSANSKFTKYEENHTHTNGSSRKYTFSGIVAFKRHEKEPVFFAVIVNQQLTGGLEQFELRTFDRIDSYAKFEDCLAKVPWVDPKVCICQ
ncbi:uncharacterized protein LOC142344608 isoform X2 [Convolutriloba macropyga]|uniref:uncharacterized protein LOC142344608 isoform X2 n=1 Tax=Convolutriloba macropyga TaxID=536237 RepID=UPI003F52486F